MKISASLPSKLKELSFCYNSRLWDCSFLMKELQVAELQVAELPGETCLATLPLCNFATPTRS